MEVSQICKIVTLRINNSPILSYSNTTASTSGDIMLGYLDAFDSIGVVQGFAVYDNARVISLNGLKITSLTIVGANVLVDFSFDLNDSPSGFCVAELRDSLRRVCRYGGDNRADHAGTL